MKALCPPTRSPERAASDLVIRSGDGPPLETKARELTDPQDDLPPSLETLHLGRRVVKELRAREPNYLYLSLRMIFTRVIIVVNYHRILALMSHVAGALGSCSSRGGGGF